MYVNIPFTASVRLCGGIFVAIPTAIPVVPFKSKLGNLEGKTDGSFKVSSKFKFQSIVSLSISNNISSAVLRILASVYRIAAGLSPSIDPKFP